MQYSSGVFFLKETLGYNLGAIKISAESIREVVEKIETTGIVGNIHLKTKDDLIGWEVKNKLMVYTEDEL